MITSFFITSAVAVVGAILSVLGSSQGFPPEAEEAVSFIGGFLGMLDPLVPTSTLLTILGILITVEFAIFSFRTLRWLFSHIPFVGGRA